MKLGNVRESFVFVEMVNDTEWIYCIHPDTNDELRYDTYEEAVGDAQDVAQEHEGKVLFIIKETKEVFASVAIDEANTFMVKMKK